MWYKKYFFEVIYPARSNGGERKAVEGAMAAEKAAMRFFKVVVAQERDPPGAPPIWRLSILLARTLVVDFMRKRMAITREIVVYFQKSFSTEITLP